MSVIRELEQERIASLVRERPVPDFRPGDTVRVKLKVVEGSRERLQAFEGVCIARKNAGLGSSFVLRKISYGEGVERIFPLYSPRIADIEVVRHGRVRRAKLYFLRGLAGKKARIAERLGLRVEGAAEGVATAAEALEVGEEVAQPVAEEPTVAEAPPPEVRPRKREKKAKA